MRSVNVVGQFVIQQFTRVGVGALVHLDWTFHHDGVRFTVPHIITISTVPTEDSVLMPDWLAMSLPADLDRAQVTGVFRTFGGLMTLPNVITKVGGEAQHGTNDDQSIQRRAERGSVCGACQPWR